jgi:hypothetical protein
MSGRNNGTTELESSHFTDSLKFADTLHKMSNMRVDEEINTGPTHLTSPVEPVPQSNRATLDACGCGNQGTPEVMDKHLNLHSCQDVISDPTFKEFSGDNGSLHVDEYRLPTISNRSPDVQRMAPYGRYYNDPYRWTADEIKAATGKEECTYVEHNLKVRSVYTDVEVTETFVLFHHYLFVSYLTFGQVALCAVCNSISRNHIKFCFSEWCSTSSYVSSFCEKTLGVN